MSKAAEESIHNYAYVKQVFQRAQRGRLIRRDSTQRQPGGYNVGPVGRDERFTAVGQDQKEMQSAVSMDGPENSQ